MLQSVCADLQTEIETPYQAKETVTRENGSGQTILDHFEDAELYTFTSSSGELVDFAMDLEVAKQYFNEHQDATGTFTNCRRFHVYPRY